MDKNGNLSAKEQTKIADHLAKILANTYALYLKTQAFHWNVTGKEFYSLHLLFEMQYEELAKATDEIAERIRAFGVDVQATFTAFKQLSSIEEEKKMNFSAHEMCKKLIEGHETYVRETRVSLEIIEELGDGGTVDLLGRRLGVHEKMIWMIRSQL